MFSLLLKDLNFSLLFETILRIYEKQILLNSNCIFLSLRCPQFGNISVILILMTETISRYFLHGDSLEYGYKSLFQHFSQVTKMAASPTLINLQNLPILDRKAYDLYT